MKHWKRLTALVLALTLCAGLLAGCGNSDEGDEVDNKTYASEGGSVTMPEGFAAEGHFTSQIAGDTLYVDFNGIQKRDTGYFAPAGDSITINITATTESEGNKEFKAALWKQVASGAQYVDGCTIYFKAVGSCYTYTITGLDPASKYRITLSYDSPKYYITGQMSVGGLATAERSDEEQQAEEAKNA